MPLTIDELCARIKNQWDVELIIEALQITADELLDRFDDKVSEHYEKLNEEMEDE